MPFSLTLFFSAFFLSAFFLAPVLAQEQAIQNRGIEEQSVEDQSRASSISPSTIAEFIEQMALLERQIIELTENLEILTRQNTLLSRKIDQFGIELDLKTSGIDSRVGLLEIAGDKGNEEQNDIEKEFQDILALLRGRQFDEAEKNLSVFIKNYPDHDLVAHAYYWLGESFYFRDQFVNASESFAEGFRKFSDHERAPFNLLKLGISLSRLDKINAACASFLELRKNYLDADKRVLGLNAEQLHKNACEGDKEDAESVTDEDAESDTG